MPCCGGAHMSLSLCVVRPITALCVWKATEIVSLLSTNTSGLHGRRPYCTLSNTQMWPHVCYCHYFTLPAWAFGLLLVKLKTSSCSAVLLKFLTERPSRLISSLPGQGVWGGGARV